MRQKRPPSLRGSVTQNNLSVRMRADNAGPLSFMTRLGLLASAFIIIFGLGFWFWHSGRLHEQAEKAREAGYSLAQKMEFAVRDITVDGRHRADKTEIFDALATERGASLFGFDPAAAATKLAKLPWIASATVERHLPDTITVDLIEREPAARWQHDDRLYVIDDQGHVLPAAQPDEFPTLPMVVGTGADTATHELLALLKNFPAVQEKTDSAVRVGERRWDLHMQSKIIVRLPEDDVAAALRRLSALITQDRVLDRTITSIDLRLPDRLTIEPVAPAPPTKVHP